MVILFDLVSTQGFLNGGAEYCKKVFYTLLESKGENEVITIVNSRLPFIYEDLKPDNILSSFGVKSIDLSSQSLEDAIKDFNIDVFFVGIVQRWLNYNLSDLKCRVICVVHDLHSIEVTDAKIKDIIITGSKYELTKYYLKKIKNIVLPRRNSEYEYLDKIFRAKNTKLISVSEFSKNSIYYYFNNLSKDINVYYSPQKLSNSSSVIENNELSKIINSGLKYYVLLSSNRPLKNASKVMLAFEKFSKINPDCYLITVGYQGKMSFDNHIILPYLTSSDTEFLLKNCYALIFSSFFEGFGYPPIEALKYGKISICSNVCSMPELLCNDAIYFSPFYSSDIFRALKISLSIDYQEFSKNALLRYHKIHNRQEVDLSKLIDFILSS